MTQIFFRKLINLEVSKTKLIFYKFTVQRVNRIVSFQSMISSSNRFNLWNRNTKWLMEDTILAYRIQGQGLLYDTCLIRHQSLIVKWRTYSSKMSKDEEVNALHLIREPSRRFHVMITMHSGNPEMVIVCNEARYYSPHYDCCFYNLVFIYSILYKNGNSNINDNCWCFCELSVNRLCIDRTFMRTHPVYVNLSESD